MVKTVSDHLTVLFSTMTDKNTVKFVNVYVRILQSCCCSPHFSRHSHPSCILITRLTTFRFHKNFMYEGCVPCDVTLNLETRIFLSLMRSWHSVIANSVFYNFISEKYSAYLQEIYILVCIMHIGPFTIRWLLLPLYFTSVNFFQFFQYSPMFPV